MVGSSLSECFKAIADEIYFNLFSLAEALITHYTCDTPKTMTVEFKVEVEEDTCIWFGAELNQQVRDSATESPWTATGPSFGFAGLDLTTKEVWIQK